MTIGLSGSARSKTPVTCIKMELLVTKVNGSKLSAVVTKSSILDCVGVIDQSSDGVLRMCYYCALCTNIDMWFNFNKLQDKNDIYFPNISF